MIEVEGKVWKSISLFYKEKQKQTRDELLKEQEDRG
jgi:hypothetical protein